MTQNEDTKQKEPRKEVRGDRFADYTLEKAYFADARTRMMSRKFGPAAIAVNLAVWAELYDRSEHKISIDSFIFIAADYGYEEAEAADLLKFLCGESVGYLRVSGEGISSDEVDSRCNKRGAKRESWRKSKGLPKDSDRTPTGIQKEANPIPSGMSSPSPSIPQPQDQKKNGIGFRLPENFNTPELRAALALWSAKLRKQGREFDQIQLDSLCMRFATPKKLAAALTFSASKSQCLNVLDPPEPARNGSGTVQARESPHPALVAQRRRDSQESKGFEQVGKIKAGT